MVEGQVDKETEGFLNGTFSLDMKWLKFCIAGEWRKRFKRNPPSALRLAEHAFSGNDEVKRRNPCVEDLLVNKARANLKKRRRNFKISPKAIAG